MKNRPAFSLKKIIFVFNVLQIIANAYVFILIVPLLKHIPYGCKPASPELDPIMDCYYYYSLLKWFDLIETVSKNIVISQSQHMTFCFDKI